MQKKWMPLFSLMLALLMTGCASLDLPFLDSAPAAEAAPTQVDADTLSTMVAEAAAQKVAATLAAIPPTETLVPTATSTPEPTATLVPTATASLTPYSGKGSELVAQGDSYVYYDYKTGYKLTTPANWLPIRPGETEYAEAWGLSVASYPEVNLALQRIQSLDPNTSRLVIFDTQEGHFEDSFLSNINLVAAPTDGASLDEIFAATVLQLPETTSDVVVLESDIVEDEAGNLMGKIVSFSPGKLFSGEIVEVYQEQIIYLFDNTALTLTFTSTTAFKDTLLIDFETMLDSLTPLR